MERNRTGQIIAIVALVASAVGISLGFAAFSNTLTIQSAAEIAPANFDVDFSTDGNTQAHPTESNKTIGKQGTVAGVPTKLTGVTKDATAGNATISNTGTGAPVISGLKANFTEPGQTVTYSFFAVNVGELDAFLREVNFATVTGGTYKSCTAKGSGDAAATQSLVDAACNDISLKVSVGGTEYLASAGSNTTITNKGLTVCNNTPVVVTITYAKTGTNGNRVDGDVDVTFGDITLVYKSLDAS